MKTIHLPLPAGRGHDIVVGGSLAALGPRLKKLTAGRRVLVASPAPVARRYAPRLLKGLRAAGFRARLAIVPDGESRKTLEMVRRLYGACLNAGLDRRSVLVALGGGVTGDAAGFAAATYMRGIPLVQCPTTLLAMVDSAIGGKTGVDLPQGKNLAGAFWQPLLVWADLSVLKTLPDRQWRTGIAEVIKYGLIADKALFEFLESADLAALKANPKWTERIVARSAAIKAGVVSRDERETRGLRELLNLGHTFGHAVESVSGYRAYTHGEAISIGMCAAARLGRRLGFSSAEDVRRIDGIFRRWGLPARARRPLPRADLLAAMGRDKKALDGRFRFVVCERIGKARVAAAVPLEIVKSVLSDCEMSS